MQPFIVIRSYREDDELKCQELVRDYIMSFSSKSFFTLCFREVSRRQLRALSMLNRGCICQKLRPQPKWCVWYIRVIIISDYTAIYSHHMGHILHISGRAAAFLRADHTRLCVFSLHQHLLLFLCQGSGAYEGNEVYICLLTLNFIIHLGKALTISGGRVLWAIHIPLCTKRGQLPDFYG